MPSEHAAVRVVNKPWGVGDLQPWSSMDGSGDAVGELWFERADKQAPTPALLLKLLFTSEPLSIQVHPDDTFARAMGMPNGKSEAWYILSAQPDAQIGVGLKHQVTPQQLRDVDPERFDRRTRCTGARLQKVTSSTSRPAPSTPSAPASCWPKSSNTATRHSAYSTMAGSANCTKTTASPLPTHGRFDTPCRPTPLTTNRTVLVASRHFVLERIELPEGSSWALLAEPETWMLLLDGHAAIGLAAASIGETIFIAGGRTSIEVGNNGLSALIAYPASRAVDSLLQKLDEQPGKPCCSLLFLQFAGRPRRERDAASPHRRHRQFAASPLRHRDFYDRSGKGDFEFTAGPGGQHCRHERPRSGLRLSRFRRLADQG